MRFLALVLTCFAALQIAVACPPPLNNWSFVANSTHTTAELIQASLLESDVGWVEIVTTSGNSLRPWPRSKKRPELNTVEYCFANPRSERSLHERVLDALEMWEDKIGTFGGKCSKHSLDVREFTDFGQSDPYCYVQSGPLLGEWNPVVPEGTLVIREDVNADPGSTTTAWSSLGYMAEGEPDRHQLVVNLEPIFYEAERHIAHEFGHIFGLVHEHQHPDRDDYMNFECSNMRGYDEAKRRVEAAGQHTMEEVCQSRALCYKYDFDLKDWIKEPGVGSNGKPLGLKSGPFDPDSIMMYESSQGQGGGDPHSVFDTPLVMWKNGGKDHPTERTSDNCHTYGSRTRVSDGDSEAIRHIYPRTVKVASDTSGTRKKIRAMGKVLAERAGQGI